MKLLNFESLLKGFLSQDAIGSYEIELLLTWIEMQFLILVILFFIYFLIIRF